MPRFQSRINVLFFTFLYFSFVLLPSCVLRTSDSAIPHPSGLCFSSSSLATLDSRWAKPVTVICIPERFLSAHAGLWNIVSYTSYVGLCSDGAISSPSFQRLFETKFNSEVREFVCQVTKLDYGCKNTRGRGISQLPPTWHFAFKKLSFPSFSPHIVEFQAQCPILLNYIYCAISSYFNMKQTIEKLQIIFILQSSHRYKSYFVAM